MTSITKQIVAGVWPSPSELSAAEKEVDLEILGEWIIDLASARARRERGIAPTPSEWRLRRRTFPPVVSIAVDAVETAFDYQFGKSVFELPDLSAAKGVASPLSRGLLAVLMAYRCELAANAAKAVADALRDA